MWHLNWPVVCLQAMGLADYVTYFFASIIVALTMVSTATLR